MIEPLPNKNLPTDLPDSGEICIMDIYNFLSNSWKAIIAFGCLGVISSIAYLLIVPNQYEAITQISVAEIRQNNSLEKALEEPTTLIYRMRNPANYSEEVIKACAYQEKKDPALSLSRDLKFFAPKGAANLIEVRVISPIPLVALSCSQAVFDRVRSLQEQSAGPLLKEAEAKLAYENDSIDAAKKSIFKADQSGGLMTGVYLVARDELTYFLTERQKTTDLIKSLKNLSTRLISPIYVSESPIAPKKGISIGVGLIGGLFFGIIFLLVRQIILRLRNEAYPS
jgi:capsular polysaccharide biosynthesis protein